MRRFVPIALLALLGAAVLAGPSSAGLFDQHFTVLAKFKDTREINPGGFAIKLALLDEFDKSDKVGKAHVRCEFRGAKRKLRCKLLAALNGEVGGSGDIWAEGNFGHGDHSLLVVDGSGDFAGAAGKAIFHRHQGRRLEKLHFDLVR
jgi:hypothetical protein